MDGQATMHAEWEALGGWELAEAYSARCLNVTAAQIRDAVVRHLDPAQASMITHRPTTSPIVAASVDDARAMLPPRSTAPAIGWSLSIDAPAVHTRAVRPEREVGAVRVYRHQATGLPLLLRLKPGACSFSN